MNDKKRIDENTLLHLYRALLKPRLIEEKMLLLLRQGRVSKWFSGIGQEAISVGCTEALQPNDRIYTMHRNLGVFTSRNVPLVRLFAQWQGKKEGFTKGRDRSFHFGAPEYHIVGMISHLGPQLSLAAGSALAYHWRKEKKVALAFTGEGGTSQGEFHEALNVASVWNLPVIFVIENNAYGLSTPVSEQYKCDQLIDRAAGYGMEGVTVDGNNILDVFLAISNIAKEIRENPRPWLVECMTFRMRGHEEASGQKYVPSHLIEQWQSKDPLITFEKYLMEKGLLNESARQKYYEQMKKEINHSIEKVFNLPEIIADHEEEIRDVYAPWVQKVHRAEESGKVVRFVDAISNATDVALSHYRELIVMGQDIAEYGGVFKVTEGLSEKYGKDRVRNTPLCESAIIGIGMGLSIEGIPSIIEMQFADFVTCGFNQIINNLAKIHFRWGQNANVMIRMPTGAGVGAGPFHSQSTEAWFFHTPGLKIVYPSTPFDAKGLFLAALEDPNPYLFFEHKAMYRKVQGEVPEGYYTIEIGKGRFVKSGKTLSIVTYGMGVHWAVEVTEELGLDADILDLRTLMPLDFPSIRETIEKTGRLLVLHEDGMTGGIGAEIAAWVTEHLFHFLDAPVFRVAGMDTPIPFARTLEEQFLPFKRLKEKLNDLIAY
ncbi:MAG TPA: dehydrogenase E1 component subunit alpha/beta [Saprospiraceae bacterium]|nr:dehydrogenase E1 component subunit alpha/beta [Saprospiraceae bacterium]